MQNRPDNHLFYGDNLDVLRKHIPAESVDLIYLDPPFNSNANYHILLKSPIGTSSDGQIEALEDTWHWNDHAEDAFDQVALCGNTNAFDLLNAMMLDAMPLGGGKKPDIPHVDASAAFRQAAREPAARQAQLL